jgi:peptidoglycan/xylan/chitin deacetylase (PgdA/CDA1 family)
MYHKVSADGNCDYLTIRSTDLEEQFHYLQQQGYTAVLLSDMVQYVRHAKPLPPRPVLITFDDGYRDNYTIMYPLLKKYGMKAGIFLVPAFLQTGIEYLQLKDLDAMDPKLVEYGLHSYDHKSYKTLTPRELEQDILRARELLQRLSIPFQPCLAFPYGAYPKWSLLRRQKFFNTLAANKVELAFRIGNRLNRLPLRNPLLIQRLDIRGDEPFQRFVHLVKYGK